MMPGQHGTSLKDYTQALTVQLQLREVPGSAIGQVVAEVESHVRETGEDPVEAFGQPGIYAAEFVGKREPGGGRAWSLLRAGALTTLGVLGVWIFVEGLFGLTDVVRVTANMILAWVAMGLMFALVVGRVDVVMADRETRTVTAGRRVQGSRTAQWLHFLALWATLLVGSAIRSRMPEGPVLVRLPGGALLLVGLALTAACLWVWLRTSDRIVDPRTRPNTRGAHH